MGLILAVFVASGGLQPMCLKAREDVPIRQIVTHDHFDAVECTSRTKSALRYDYHRQLAYAAVALNAGDIVRRWPDAEAGMVKPGDRLVVRVNMGTVAVEREVVALQAARVGRRLFVQDRQGKVFAIRLMGAQ
jgi:hypothetical protein